MSKLRSPIWQSGYQSVLDGNYDESCIAPNPYEPGTEESMQWNFGRVAAWDERGEYEE
jgi:hypothetical protein